MKGKHAAASERRRAAVAAESQAQAAERTIAKLTAELAALGAASRRERSAFEADIRTLKRQVAEGASTALEVAERRVTELGLRLHEVETQRRKDGLLWAGWWEELIAVLRARGGITEVEAVAIVNGATGNLAKNYDIADAAKLDREGVEAVYRARRSAPGAPDVTAMRVIVGEPNSRRLPFDIFPAGHPLWDELRAIKERNEAAMSEGAAVHQRLREIIESREAAS